MQHQQLLKPSLLAGPTCTSVVCCLFGNKPMCTLLADTASVHAWVQVLSEPLDMQRLWHVAPYIAEFVEDLPEGKLEFHCL